MKISAIVLLELLLFCCFATAQDTFSIVAVEKLVVTK